MKTSLPNPAFVLYEDRLRQNLDLIRSVMKATGVDVILALKAFAYWPAFPIIGEYLSGATASSLHEALLIKEHLGQKPYTYAPAYQAQEIDQLADMSAHLTFNSLTELERHRSVWQARGASVGLRVNPEYSPVETALYNPADRYGRLGETLPNLPSRPPDGLKGLHVHTLCESTAAQTATLIERVEAQFGHYLNKLEWLNLGGGHLMTKPGYELEVLVEALNGLRSRRPHLRIVLEPGSAIVWNAGELRARVLDIVENYGRRTAMLNVSFTCHMPDTLEMPYRPVVSGASSERTSTGYAYRLGGVSCLAGDYLDDYYFTQPLLPGDELIFEDMAHYTTVKTTQFNGVGHPDLVLVGQDRQLIHRRQFGFTDYESRMG
ncbi:MAG: carboxynorspermidine decarboxylase [Bacteroidota bacterium]